MSEIEKKENKAIERMVGQKSSAAYRSARRAKIPVTVLRGEVIYRVTSEGSFAIGKVDPKVTVRQKVVTLK